MFALFNLIVIMISCSVLCEMLQNEGFPLLFLRTSSPWFVLFLNYDYLKLSRMKYFTFFSSKFLTFGYDINSRSGNHLTQSPPIDPAPVLANEIGTWDHCKHFSARSAPISDGARSISVSGFAVLQNGLPRWPEVQGIGLPNRRKHRQSDTSVT